MLNGLPIAFRRHCSVACTLVVIGWLSAYVMPAAMGAPTPPDTGAARSASAGLAKCPLKSSSAIPSGDAWAFTETGLPSGPHLGVTSSYTHGRGTWTAGHGAGTICHEDGGPGRASHNLVLAVAGSSRVSPHITRLGRLGAGLVLNVTVSASDDLSCPIKTLGNVTLFASYYQGHHDSVRLHFTSGCVAYDFTFMGPLLHALIAQNGRQVNHG